MKRQVAVEGARVVVRAHPNDAIARVKQLRLRNRLNAQSDNERDNAPPRVALLSETDRDLILLALLQEHDLL